MAYGKISDKQREILEYIKKEILNKGYPPTAVSYTHLTLPTNSRV